MPGTPSQAKALRRLNRRFLLRAGVALAILVLSPLLFWLFEHQRNPEVTNAASSFAWLARTLFEGGSPYDIRTAPGYAVYYVVGISGVSLVAFVTGALASRFVSTVLSKGKGMGVTKHSGHILICGWSSKGAEIIRELRAKEVEDPRPIVVLAPLENDPTKDDDVEFLRGDPSDEVDLRRARVEVADTAIILADDSNPNSSASDRDARTLLTCLAIESINPECYSCVEVIRSENRQHFDRTRVNEMVVSAELTGALLASSAVTHGLTGIVTDLMTHPVGHEFYRVRTPTALVGMNVADALGALKRNHDATLVGVLSEGDRFDVNPDASRSILAGDDLLVIAAHPFATS